MSWFDASGFANLAKSALKEAQKTIDKALDIKDEEQKTSQTPPPPPEMTDFFATWGLKPDEHIGEKSDQPSQKQQSSIWGSFTGSFFENPKIDNQGLINPIKHSKSLQESFDSKEPIKSSTSFSESLNSEGESRLKVENSILPEKHSKLFTDEEKKLEFEKRDHEPFESESLEKKSEIKKSDLNAVHNLKRISIISCESDKKSSESVEILGSQPNSDCTTPESEINSVSQSLSLSLPDPKITSESVEILPDSLVTSPSSVEVLGDWKSDSSPFLSPTDQKQSEKESAIDVLDAESCSDISPYESPMEEPKNVTFENKFTGTTNSLSVQKEELNKISPDNVEVAPDVDESDEISLADDSYTSASETTVMTILESFQQGDAEKRKKECADIKMHDSFPDSHISMNSSVEYPLNISLDSIKEKHNLHLPLEPITTQPIRKMEYLETVKNITEIDPFEQMKSSTIEPSEPETYTENIQSLKTETAEVPDQYLMLTDSSCEGTLIESSSEDNATLVGNAETKITEAPLTSSSYVKSMLADAMYEKSDNSDTERHCIEVPRENSPISSER